MTDGFEERRKAQEESYFDKENKKKLEELAAKGQTAGSRPSPATGKPMVKEEIFGITVDKCPDTGGVWLDADKLKQIIEKAKETEDDFLTKFLAGVVK